MEKKSRRKDILKLAPDTINGLTALRTMSILTFLFVTACFCNGDMISVEFHGLRPTDPAGRIGLANPERGFRIETKIGIAPGEPNYEVGDERWLTEIQKYQPFGVRLAQGYCYLKDYVNSPLPGKKLDALQKSFDLARANGIKFLLRFAYEQDMKGKGGPTFERIMEHLQQLGPLIKSNADVIYVMQAGFVGAWGEWHSATDFTNDGDYDKKACLLAKILELLPADRKIQVRYPKIKRLSMEQNVLFGGYEEANQSNYKTNTPAVRIGYNNDGFLADKTDGGTWTEEPYFGSPGNPEYDYMTRESPFVPVDGELFWSDYWGQTSGLTAAMSMRLHHYTSFSLAHCYSDRQGQNFSIDKWMAMPISKQTLAEKKMPISNGYFEDAYGDPVARTEFEYIRDHLGYRFELQTAEFTSKMAKDDVFTLKASLVNRGFSILHNPRDVYCVLADNESNFYELKIANCDPTSWQPFKPGDAEYKPLVHTITFETTLPKDLEPGTYRIGLWLPDKYSSIKYASRYAIRFANRDILWWQDQNKRYGLNILGNIEVQK